MTASDKQVCPKPQGYNVEELFSSFYFEVPVYQRIFTWGDEQFERLFKNLIATNDSERYYLGVITIVRSQTHHILVDGQQRLTCILLLGALLNWKLDLSRLTYAARPKDKKALEDVYSICQERATLSFDDISKIGNEAMAGFLHFASTGEGLIMLEELRKKSETIKEKLTLMVSILPDDPYRNDIFEQNRYFEKMNYGGKQLEPHEILKVKMCRGLDSSFLKKWISISDFGRCYETETTDVEASSIESCSLFSALSHTCTPLAKDHPLLSEVYKQCGDKNKLRQYELGIEERDDLRKGLISFQTFLLHVRSLYMNKAGDPIGDESQLLNLFRDLTVSSPEERQDFIDLMKDYRIFLDWNIIHIITIDGESRYSFYEKDTNGIRDTVLEEKQASMRFQSMLYASSGADQKWLLDAFTAYRKNPAEFTLDKLKRLTLNGDVLNPVIKTAILEKTDVEKSEWPDDLLKYGSDNRRWFALLDYIIWERFVQKDGDVQRMLKCVKFNPYWDEIVSAIQNYVFRRNRSVEHLHPQTDNNATDQGEWKDKKDIFGNLALISAGRNSEYGNLSVGGKADRVVKLLKDGGKTGSKIESIKLLLMLAKCNGEDDKWTVELARNHAKDMLFFFHVFLKNFQSEPERSENAAPVDEHGNDNLAEVIAALGTFIENTFFNFDGEFPNGYSLCVAQGDDAEAPNEWCGRYFIVTTRGAKPIKCWVGWRYGGQDKTDRLDEIDFTTTPSFAIQIPPDVFPNLSGEWYKTIGTWKWCNMDLVFDIKNRDSWKNTAEEFKAKIRQLCEENPPANAVL